MTKKTIFSAILISLLGFTVFCGCPEKDAGGNLEEGDHGMESKKPPEELPPVTPEIQWEEKEYWTGTIDEDFDGNTVIVLIDRNISGLNKVHEKSFFGDIEIESIEDLTRNTVTVHQCLHIKLPGDSKENVVKAIRHLEKIEGILYAGPNFFYYPGM